MDLQFLDSTDADDVLTQLRNPAHFQGFLQVMAHFSSYSWRNIFMIYQQMPHATKLADFDTWKKTYGRSVKQGSNTIKINAPVEQKPKKKFVEKIDPTTGAVMLDDDGKRMMEEVTITRPPQFKLVRLLDVSQTNGEPLPILAGNVMDNEPLQQAFEDVLQGLCADDIGTCTQSRLKHIAVERLGNADSDGNNFLSDSIVYVACHRFGVSCDLAEFDPTKANAIDANTLETISKQAGIIISTIENKFTHLCKERNLDPMTLPKTAESISKDELAEMQVQTAEAPSETPPTQTIIPSPPTERTAQTEPQPLKHPPDPTITITERNQYGYTRPELLPLNKDRAIALFLRDMPIYMLYTNNTEAIAHYLSDLQTHNGIFGVAHGNWQNSREYIALASGNPEAIQEAKFVYDGGDSFAVYQIKQDNSPLGYKSYEEIQAMAQDINRQNYHLVYTAALPTPPSDTPEGIFMWVNAEQLDDYKGRTMAISDVLSIKKDGAITSHYANGRTFRELLAFVGEEGRRPKVAETEPPAPDIVEQAAPPPLQTQPPPQDPPDTQSPSTTPAPPSDTPENKANTDIYRLSADEAATHNATSAYNASRQADIDCASVIDEAIQHHKTATNRYDLTAPAKSLLEEYGANRMMWVLSRHMLSNPKAFTPDNLSWANDFINDGTGSGDATPAFTITTRPVILDAFITEFRNVLSQTHSFSHRIRKAKIKSDAHNNASN